MGLGPFAITHGRNPQNSGRVRLSGDAREEYLNTRNQLLKLLKDKNSDCAKFLRDVVGISASRIARTVRAQRAFDGDASTISMEGAGLLPRGSIGEVEGYFTQSSARVSEFFAGRRATAAQAGFARASTGASQNDVYYLPGGFMEQQILHEALHTFFGASEGELDKRHADLTSLGHAGCSLIGHAN